MRVVILVNEYKFFGVFKAAMTQFAHLENFNLNFSKSSVIIHRVYLLSSLWCLSILVNYYFQVSFT